MADSVTGIRINGLESADSSNVTDNDYLAIDTATATKKITFKEFKKKVLGKTIPDKAVFSDNILKFYHTKETGETSDTFLFQVDLSSISSGGGSGQDGVGISNIAKTGTSGLVDTYTITLTDNSTYTFTVTNGKDGASASTPTLKKLTINGVEYDGTEEVNITIDSSGASIAVDNTLSSTSLNPISNKAVTEEFNNVRQEIPSNTSDLNNDSGFLTSIPLSTSTVVGGVKADAKDSNDTVPVRMGSDGKLYVETYPTGSGTFVVDSDGILSVEAYHTGSGTVVVDSELSSTSENPVQNKVIYDALTHKAGIEDLPSIATETESGLVYPNSSYFMVGTDGKLSPKILEELNDDTTSIKFATSKAIVDYVKAKSESKADQNQGIANAGKYWKVGSDGKLTFGTPATGGNGNGMTGIANVKDYGAVGDGVENDTQAFLDAFDACNTVYVPHGTYVLNRMLIQNRTNITMIGYGATIKAIDNHPLWVGVLEFRNVTGLNLLGITVDGNKEGNSDYDQSRGSDNFRFVEVHNFLVKDCVSKNSFHGTMRFANSCSNGVIDNYIGDDIDVGIQFCAEDREQYNSADDKSIFASHDIRITNCFNRGGTSEGIGFYECPGIDTVSAQYMHYNIEIDNCVFDSKSEGGVSSPFMNVKNLNIKNCKYLNTFGLNNTGLRLGQVEDVNVVNCTFEGVHHGALVLEGGVQKNVNITNCVFGKDCGSAITMSKTNGDTLDTTFKDCIFRDINSESQWFGVDCNGVRFLNCSFEAKDVESNIMMLVSKNISTDIINCTFEDAFGTAIPIMTFAGDTNATVRLIGNTGLKHFTRWTITNINDTDLCVISNNECYDLNYSDESGDEHVTIYTLGLRYIEFKATNANPKLEKLAYYGKDNDVLTIKFVNAITLQIGKVSYTPMSARTVSAGSLVSFVCKNNKWIEIANQQTSGTEQSQITDADVDEAWNEVFGGVS